MPREKVLRRVRVPIKREDDLALKTFVHLGISEGELIRAFWRIGLNHRDELSAGRAANTAQAPAEETPQKPQIKAVK